MVPYPFSLRLTNHIFLGSHPEFRKKNAGKKKAASQTKDVKKKRKLEEEPSDKNEGSESKQDGNDEDNAEEDGTGDDWTNYYFCMLTEAEKSVALSYICIL